MGSYLTCKNCGYYPVENMSKCPRCGTIVSDGSIGQVLLLVILIVTVLTIMVIGSLVAGIKSLYNFKKGKKRKIIWLIISYILGILMLCIAHVFSYEENEFFDWYMWAVYIGNGLGILLSIYITISIYRKFQNDKLLINPNISKSNTKFDSIETNCVNSQKTGAKDEKIKTLASGKNLSKRRSIKILLFGLFGSLLIGLALWLAFTFLWQTEKVYSDSVSNSRGKFRKVEFKENYKAERDSQKQIDGFLAGQTVIANIKKVYFYSQPDNNSKTESYFVNGQEALITEDAQGDFVKVSFEYNNVITEGYILKSEVVLKNENGN